jgi:hypothetical protein
MIKAGKIFFIIMLMVFVVKTSYSQNSSHQADTLNPGSTLSQSDKDVKNQTAMGTETGQTGPDGMSNGIQTAKRIRSGRPDMSKARGARPPLVVRPSGSGIPKGAGKPGGAGAKRR